jgi:transcriptional regulator with XRE-family HTH domain
VLAVADNYSFSMWLLAEMSKLGISQSELARRAGVTRSAINGVVTGARGPGPDLCNAIARALNIPPEQVFQAAGLLPPAIEQNSKVDELAHLAQSLGDDDLDDLIELARIRAKKREVKNTVHKQQSSRSLKPARSVSRDS